MVQIVTVNVSQDIAPTPNTLQQTGAVASVGGTTLTANQAATLTSTAGLTSILASALVVSSITWASSLLTITTAAPHGLTVGTSAIGLLQGQTPALTETAYLVFTATSTTVLTAPYATTPGTITVPGTLTWESVFFLQDFVDTFFAQGENATLDVLELGLQGIPTAITTLETYIANNPFHYYCIALPDFFDGASGMTAFLSQYENTTAKIYFFLSTQLSTYTGYSDLEKDLVTFITSPNAPADVNSAIGYSERPAASMMYKVLSYSPSATNLVTPMAFTEVYGVTAYPARGNSATLLALKAAAVNVVQSAQVGGIAGNILTYGTTMDGRDFTYWYSVDWMQINVALDLTNAIINGSNNPVNPLYYNQAGIDTLQSVSQDTANTGISYGLAVSPISITATSFQAYTQTNPSDYAIGRYAGLAMSYTPARGFESIIFNITVTDFVAA
jgi:hypothetical protein